MADASKTRSPEKKALDYALGTLGVNTVYEKAVADRELLQETLDELIGLRQTKRQLEDIIELHVLDLQITTRSEHPEVTSQAALDRLVKEVLGKDSELRVLKGKLEDVQLRLEKAEADRRLNEHDISIGNARMHELGGMLQFMAVLKQMSLVGQQKPDPTDPWQQPAAPGPQQN